MLLQRRGIRTADFDSARQKRSEGDQEEEEERERDGQREKAGGRAEERDD